MYIAQNIFEEIHKFLSIDLVDENLSSTCRIKLISLINKLQISINQSDISKQSVNIYDDYNIYEEPCKKENRSSDFNFELPKKLIKCRNDYQNMTLSGPLYYRYNLQCWEHYPSSMLIDGRLVCCKISPNNSNNANNATQLPMDNYSSPSSGKNSELSIFLMGYTAVMTWKDCGMNFVFKLTHPTEDTKVFATETEEEALSWIEQINQYALGATPMDVKIFKDDSSLDMDTLDEFDFVAEMSAGIESTCVDEAMKINENSHLRRQPSDVLNIINNSTITNPNFLISDLKFNRSRSNNSFKNVPLNGTPNNLQNNGYTGSIGSGGGTSIISSMRRKVESFGNKYRNRKSFAGFSSKNFNVNGLSQSTSFCKAKTMSPASPDDNKRCSLYSVQLYPSPKDLIYSGVAKLRLQGNRAGWMERWCQLKPKLLECYHLQSNNNGMKPTLDFALCLENLTLGLSNDKKHRSALRLSCDHAKQDLLFEVQDKVLMGDWIKSFIEALGISSQKPISLSANSPTQSARSQDLSDDIMHRSLTTIQSIGSDSIYDEVCSSDIKDLEQCLETPPTPITNMYFQRRWSSPAIELPVPKLLNSLIMQPPSAPYAGRRCLREHPLPSLPASSPDSEHNSDNMADTPTGNNDIEIDSVYDYSSTFGKNIDPSRTSTLKTKDENETYPIFDSSLKRSIIYADQEPGDEIVDNQIESIPRKFNDNKQHWRVQGCSLADLIARFEPQSESQEHSSATMSSKTDSSCTPTYHNSSEDNINSISNSFMSIHSVDNSGIDLIKKVCRSVSADTDLSFIHHHRNNRRDRPKSLLMKKTSLELVFEELLTVKEDLRNLKKQKNELQKAQSQSNKKESTERLNSIITDITNQIKVKESRVKELSNHSRKRFTLEIVTNLNRQSSRLSAD